MTDNVNYKMKISKNVLQHLGVQLYDTISAVLSEFISNSHDADANNIKIYIEGSDGNKKDVFGKCLSKRNGESLGYKLIIEDDGHGMNPEEINEYFLNVGRCRREKGQSTTPKGRPVMGNKGIGKLAPFGICSKMEIISSGGKFIENSKESGYRTGHIILEKDKIFDKEEDASDYEPRRGESDREIQSNHKTKIILSEFDYKQVPEKSLLASQIASRYDIDSLGLKIVLHDTTLEEIEIPTKNKAKIILCKSISDSNSKKSEQNNYKYYLFDEMYLVNIYKKSKWGLWGRKYFDLTKDFGKELSDDLSFKEICEEIKGTSF